MLSEACWCTLHLLINLMMLAASRLDWLVPGEGLVAVMSDSLSCLATALLHPCLNLGSPWPGENAVCLIDSPGQR